MCENHAISIFFSTLLFHFAHVPCQQTKNESRKMTSNFGSCSSSSSHSGIAMDFVISLNFKIMKDFDLPIKIALPYVLRVTLVTISISFKQFYLNNSLCHCPAVFFAWVCVFKQRFDYDDSAIKWWLVGYQYAIEHP